MNQRLLVCILLSVLLSSCGFKLRGQANLPKSLLFLYIDNQQPAGAPPNPLLFELRQALRSNGVVLLDEADDSSARLRIVNEDYRRRTLATNRSGAVRKFNLEYIVTFSVFDANATPLVEAAQVSAIRNIVYDESQILGRVEGEQIAQQDMQRDVVNAILRRLQTL